MRTPMEVFESDTLFHKAIEKRLLYGDNMTVAGIRKTLRTCSGTQGVSNFRPTAAASIYDYFLPEEGGTVWDQSCGFGGRLLGALTSSKAKKYYGTDPSIPTWEGLQNMQRELVPMAAELGRKHLEVEIHPCGSEVPEVREFIPPGSLDLCFTSPPYFDTEKYEVYSPDSRQSYIRYPSKELWLTGFMKQTLQNCHYGLKSTGTLVINIARVRSYPKLAEDFVAIATASGFRLVRTLQMELSKMMGTRGKDKNTHKLEPIFVFNRS